MCFNAAFTAAGAWEPCRFRAFVFEFERQVCMSRFRVTLMAVGGVV